MVRPSLSVSAKLPPVFVKAPRPAIWLAPLSVVVPTALPVSDDAEIAPDPLSTSVPSEFRIAAPPAVSWLLTAILPDVVVSARLPVPELTAPFTVNASSSVNEKPPEPVFVNAPSVAIWLAPFNVVPPVELPVRDPESIVPVLSPIVPVSTSVTP